MPNLPDPMPANVSPESWKYLARVVRERREFIGLSQDDVVRFGGPAKTTVSKIERASATSYSPRTQQQLEKALGWDRGTFRTILNIAEEHPDEMESAAVDFVEDELPDLTQLDDAEPAEGVATRSARDLTDAELLAELTYRMTLYGQLLDEKGGEEHADRSAPKTEAGGSVTQLRRGSSANPVDERTSDGGRSLSHLYDEPSAAEPLRRDIPGEDEEPESP